MSNIKLIAIDMDGTLLNDQREITPAVKNAINKASQAGIYVVLCTGRPILGVNSALTELNLLQHKNYVISYNGALVQRTDTQDILFKSLLNYDDFIRIEALSRQLNLHCHALDMQDLYTTNKDISEYTVTESYLCNIALKYRTVDEFPTDLSFLKMMMVDPPKILTEGIRHIPADFYARYTIIRSAGYYLEILNKDASKGRSLARLAAHLNIDPQHIMAIGDNENDIDMLEYAGLGVAMGNAVLEVKQICDVETATNEEDGVAKAIEKFALLS